MEDYKTISFNKVKGTVLHWAFDKVNASYDYGESESLSPFSGESFTDNTQINVKYDVDPVEFEKKKKLLNWLPVLPFERYEKFADLEFTLTPSELNYEYKHNIKNQAKINVEGVKDETLTDTVDETYNFGYEPFNGLRYTFTRQTSDDLDIGQEVSFVEQNRISLTGPSMLYLQNSYSYSANYNETDNPRYSLQSSLGSKSVRLNKSFTFTGSLEVNKFFEDISGRPKAPRQKFQREKKKDDEWETE